MYRTGYQMRSIKMSNPSLGPERSDSFEIGSDYQPVDNLKLSGSGYYSQVYDYMGCLTNGYATPEAAEQLGDIFSFLNISLKGLSPDFCRRYLGIPDSEPVIRTIRQLAKRCHVEVATPIIESENDHELDQMADILADINPETPWHAFRLLPTHKMTGQKYPSITGLNDKLEALRKRLPHIYFHNFIGSEWVDTHCPDCGATVITRFSLGCGGDKLDQYLANGDCCPSCGRRLYMSVSSWVTSVPGSSVKVDRTRTGTLYFLANSTERICRTLAPMFGTTSRAMSCISRVAAISKCRRDFMVWRSRRTSRSWIWRRSSRRWTMMARAPASSARAAAATGSGCMPSLA